MRPIIYNTALILTGLLKEVKDSHKLIAEYEAHIARERQLISAKIEAQQAKLALDLVQRKRLLAREDGASLSAISTCDSTQSAS